jgi:lipopolysaccharide export system ATP-binding protein
MSYTDERDELAELFGVQPAARQKGYSKEIDLPAPTAAPAAAANTGPSPLPLPEVKKPVKLRPPAHVEPHPLETPPPRPAPAPQAKPLPLPETLIEDEDFRVYDEGDLPDFSDFNFLPVEKETAPAPRAKTSPGKAPAKATAPPVKASPVLSAPSLSSPSLTAPPLPEPTALPQKPVEPLKPAPALAEIIPPPSPPAATTPSRVQPNQEIPRRVRHERREDLHFESDETLAHDDTSASLLNTKGLVKIYDGRTVVNGVDIHVRPGEIVGLLGPNGAGKTTSFYMIVGLVPPNGGQVLFNGNDVTHMPMYKRARLGMGYLPQEESIFRKLTVEENLMAVLETLDLPRKERLARCQELLERFSITHIRKNVALTCSGGEKRRLTIARSLVTTPSLLMLDEPFSGVDPIAVNEIQNIVQDLRRSGLAILITDHNARQTLELVDRAYLIYEGRVLREGTRDFLINDPVSRELYLGDRFTM